MRTNLSRLAYLVVALSAPAVAQAQGTVGGPITGDMTNANVQTGVNSAISTGQIGSNSRARATGGSAAGGNARGGTGGAVTNNLQVGSGAGGGTVRYEGRYTVRNNPDLAALAAGTANSCATPTGATGSGFGIGFGFMTTPESKQCNDRANAAMLIALGQRDAALQLLAQNPAVRQALEAAREAAPRQAVQTAAAPAVPSYCLPAAGERAVDRLMRERNCGL